MELKRGIFENLWVSVFRGLAVESFHLFIFIVFHLLDLSADRQMERL
jgi:hypothetical protein